MSPGPYPWTATLAGRPPVSGFRLEHLLARNNYNHEKRQRELNKARKKEEKRQRKLDRKETDADEIGPEPTESSSPPADVPLSE